MSLEPLRELLNYHIEQTDKRLERIELKIDQLMKTEVKINLFAPILASVVTSAVVGYVTKWLAS